MAAAKTNVDPTGPVKQTSQTGRLLYIDNLRVLLTIMVVLIHLAIGYGAEGDWYYNEEGEIGTVSAVLMTTFVAVNQSFFMGFFFLVSSYFGAASHERKGPRQYTADRLKRLGIPLLIFTVLIQPLLLYIISLYYGSSLSLWLFVSEMGIHAFGVGPLWFVESLLIFGFIYSLWRHFSKPKATPAKNTGEAPGNGVLLLFAVVLGLLTFVVRIWLPVGWWFEPLHLQLAHFPQYIALYAVGATAYRRNWFAEFTAAQGAFWTRAAILLVVLFPVIAVLGGALHGNLSLFLGGLSWQALSYSIWEQLLCVAMVVSLLVWFRSRFNRQDGLTKAMSGAAYTVYVFHAPIIVLLGIAMKGIRLDLGLKFLLVAPIAVSLCFGIGYLIKRLPIVGKIL